MKKIAAIISACAAAFSLCAAVEKSYDVRIWDNYPIKENAKIWENVPQILKEAIWIWPAPFPNVDITNSYALFRVPFELDTVPQKAVFYITADQNYRLYVNGKFICKGPARGYQKSWPYDEVDIAPYLQKGKNIIAIRAYNAGRDTFGYVSEGWAGVLYGIDFGNGKKIISNPKTKCVREEWCDKDTFPYSMQLNNQEHIDMRKAPTEAWKLYDFDDSKWTTTANSWEARWNRMPYYTFEPRFTPFEESKIIESPKLIGENTGKTFSEDERVRNINVLISNEDQSHKSAHNDGDTITVPPSPKGTFRSYLFDLGRVQIGVPILEVKGAKGGEIIDITMDERVLDNLVLRNNYKQHCAVSIGSRMIARAGDNYHEFYHAMGSRYMMIRVRANPDSTLEIKPSFRWEAYPLRSDGKFETSNPAADKIWKACEHTQRLCSLDAYVDTPWREQAQWWGDARVQAWNTFAMCNDPRLLWRGIRSIAMQTAPNGLTYGHAPTMAHHCILPDYSIIWILTLYDYYWQTGDASIFATYEKTIDGILSYFDGITDANGLVRYDPRYWLFLDWSNVQRDGNPAILNLWLLYALDTVSDACAKNGYSAMSAKYAARAKVLRTAIEKNLVVGGLAIDGILPNGKPSKNNGIQAQVLARMTNLKGFDFERAKNEIMLPYLRGKLELSAPPSSYWIVYLYELLIDEGYGREVYADILKRWKEMGEYGSAFEGFDWRTGSSSHAWTAHPLFLMPRILGGIRQKAPAWREVSFNPQMIEDSGNIVYPTPQGNIKFQWKKQPDGTFDKKLELPAGIKLVK